MAVAMFIVGYPTETLEDFQETMDMLTKYTPYLYNGTIVEARLGGTQHIEPMSALGRDPDIVASRDSEGNMDIYNWTYTKNPDLTFKERIRRRLVIMEHAQQLGYLSPTNNQEIAILKKKWQLLKEQDEILNKPSTIYISNPGPKSSPKAEQTTTV